MEVGSPQTGMIHKMNLTLDESGGNPAKIGGKYQKNPKGINEVLIS